MSYEYFYNREAEQYIMPKLLFQAGPLNNISLNAKLLYSFLLDRAKSSYKNGFVDKDGKVYVYFPQKELIQLMNCSRTKMSAYMKELDELDKQKALYTLMNKLNEAEASIRKEGTISADDLEAELGV